MCIILNDSFCAVIFTFHCWVSRLFLPHYVFKFRHQTNKKKNPKKKPFIPEENTRQLYKKMYLLFSFFFQNPTLPIANLIFQRWTGVGWRLHVMSLHVMIRFRNLSVGGYLQNMFQLHRSLSHLGKYHRINIT